MNIEIDLSLLKENHLSPDDYIFLYLIWRKGFNTVESIPLRINAKRLQDDDWIILNDENDHTKFIVQQKFKDLYLADADKMFEELVEYIHSKFCLLQEDLEYYVLKILIL